MSWLHKIAMDLKIVPECIGASHGQTDCVLKAYFEERIVGYISYSIFQGETHVKYIEVAEDMKRQGIASQLAKALEEESDGKINWAMSTDEGTAFLEGTGRR